MDRSPSFNYDPDGIASWEDLNTRIPEPENDPATDIRSVDPRPLPPEVVEIDKNIAELESQLAALKHKRERLLGDHAPISRLPPEILCRIFELGVDEYSDLILTINLVSRHWRDVALACPVLWTYIVLDMEWGWRMPAFLRKLRAHLQRSQGAKLHVDLDLCQVDDIAAQTVMTELRPHLARCFSFLVFVPNWARMHIVRENATELGPALESLYLRIDYSQAEVEDPVCMLTQPCPRLVQLKLEHAPLDCVNVALPALRQVLLCRDLSCHSSIKIGFPFKALMSRLTASSLLCFEMCSAVFNLDAAEDTLCASPNLYELPDLEQASFSDVDSASISLFLDSTSLPNLLALSVHSGDDIHWITRVSLFPQRFPSLRVLDLRNINLTGAGLSPFMRALHQLPQLTGLGLTSPSTGLIGSRFFEMLAAGPETIGEWILPRLEALCFQACPDVSGHDLLGVVTARRAAAQVSNLSYVKFSQCYNVDPQAVERLESLVHTVRVR
ncbi:hypothetical protein BD414DRAFT_159710 [Trametes punicea]|nr:hypothetical protein BD414DRAFT_159710 [Trametes punicea]